MTVVYGAGLTCLDLALCLVMIIQLGQSLFVVVINVKSLCVLILDMLRRESGDKRILSLTTK